MRRNEDERTMWKVRSVQEEAVHDGVRVQTLQRMPGWSTADEMQTVRGSGGTENDERDRYEDDRRQNEERVYRGEVKWE